MKNGSLTAIATTCLVLIVQAASPVTARAADNSWTNLLGDKWETATNWSLGVAPTNTQSTILITNATTKTVTIDATTSGTFPSTLTISNLQVFAPATFTNTLFLNNSGTLVPLDVLDGLIISNGGVLFVSNSVLIVNGVSGDDLFDDGTVVLDGVGGNLITTNVTTDVGNFGAGQMTVSNGMWLALNVTMGLNAGSSGTLTIAGGTNSLVLTNALSTAFSVGAVQNSTGTVWVTGGNLMITSNVELVVGDVGVGQMALSNGTVSAGILEVARSGVGTLTIAGGTLLSSNAFVSILDGSTGTIWMTAGQLIATNELLVGGVAGQMILSNGTVSTPALFVPGSEPGEGTFTIAGGTCATSFFSIGNGFGSTGAVWMTGGQLIATNSLSLGGFGPGQMTLSNGTINAGNTFVEGQPGGTLTVAGGALLSHSLTVGDDFNTTGAVWVTGGTLMATNNSISAVGFNGVGQLTVSNGTLVLNSVETGSSGTITIAGGTNQFSSLAIAGFSGATGAVWITGGQLSMSAELSVGEEGAGQMTMSNGTVLVGALNVGSDIGSSGTMTVDGGILTITNQSHTGFLTVGDQGQGAFVLNNGVVTADFLIVTNGANSVFNQNGGMLNTINTTVMNGSEFTVGDGIHAATFNLLGGIDSFANNLFISTNALLTGCGTINGAVVNLGTITNNCSTLTFNGVITNNGTIVVGSGATAVFVSPVVNNGLIDATAGTALFLSNVVNNGTLDTNRPPVASFSGAPTNGIAPLLVTFSDTSTGTITNRSWIFGDGGTTNTLNTTVAHTYNSAGTDMVTLITTGPLGVSTNTRANYIIVTNGLPHLVVSPGSRDFGLLVVGQSNTQTFSVADTGLQMLAGTATVSGASFALVSGSPFTVNSGQTGLVSISFNPGAAGAFTGSVVFASNGGVSTNAVTGSAAIAPTAGFAGTPTNGAATLLVNFTDASSGTVTGRAWSFGDGGTSTLTSPNHSYTTAGTFSVSLTVFGPVGSNILLRTNYITVTNVFSAPVAGFTASPTNGAVPLLVNFTDASSGTVTSRAWSFGDGGTSALTSPSHSYTNAGTFSVSLTVFGPGGSNMLLRANDITVTNVFIAPVAAFTVSPTNGTAPLLVNFTDASTGTITNHSWVFGDGSMSTASSPSHLYSAAGIYSVTLTVSGPGGSNALDRANLITVTNGVTTPPTVRILRPASGMLYPTLTNLTITVVASVSVNDGGSLNKIEFFSDNTKLGEATSSPGTNFLIRPTPGLHIISARASDTFGLTNISAGTAITVGAKNSPLGDWEVTISGADKGAQFLTFEDDFSANGYGIRLKSFGLDDVSGHWGFSTNNPKGQVTGPFVERTGTTTNWTGTLLGPARAPRTITSAVKTTTLGTFHWRGIPATTFPDLSGTWTGLVTEVRTTPVAVSYAISSNANDSAVFDIATTADPGAMVGQLLVTSRNKVYGYVTFDGKPINFSGTFGAARTSLTLRGTDPSAEKFAIKLFQ